MDNTLQLFDILGILARKRLQTAERFFSSLGLNHTEARLLSLLDQEGGVATQNKLSDSLFIDRSNTGRALKYLEQEEYIARCSDNVDKRANVVSITPKGCKAVSEIDKLRKKIAQTFFYAMEEDEVRKTIEFLIKTLTHEEVEMVHKRQK